MTAKELLLEQFKACYNEDNWFVAAESALAELTADEADWKPENLDNSIREIVNHLAFWNERWLRRLRGETLGDAPENDATFNAGNEEDWPAAKEKLFRVLADWEKILSELGEARFGEQVSAEYDEPWALPITNTNIHNAYHLGQIVVIRKLQGSWDSSKGVS